jgi:phosphate:Na+ symporter
MDLAGQIAQLIGGIGLFLLGMKLITDGLRASAGSRLRDILAVWTRTRLRGLAAGLGLTALVQSSTAVVVATIGFVNAGLLTLTEAVWVVFGTNVGTTTTGWIVALIGLKLKLEAYALPLVGIGMLVRLIYSRDGSRAGAMGTALAGFGLFFLGIGVLAEAFEHVGAGIDPAAFAGGGWAARLVFIGIGIVLTAATQSSSAAIAIILTATADGRLPFELAAASVIGANIGTTTTAVFAAIGATPAAKRVAAAHIAFNVVTGAVAVALLSVLLSGIDEIREALGLADDKATSLALFHTTFNILGVLLMWPLSGMLVGWLEHRFVDRTEDEARPRYLDNTVVGVPDLALSSLILETKRLGEMAGAIASDACAPVTAHAARRAGVVTLLAGRIQDFIAGLGSQPLPREVAEAVPHVLRAIQHYEEVATLAAAEIDAFRTPVPPAVSDRIGTFRDQARSALAQATAALKDASLVEQAAAENRAVEAAYQALKAELLQSAAAGTITVAALDDLIRRIDANRRMVNRIAKAARRMAQAEATMPHASTGAAGPNSPETM